MLKSKEKESSRQLLKSNVGLEEQKLEHTLSKVHYILQALKYIVNCIYESALYMYGNSHIKRACCSLYLPEFKKVVLVTLDCVQPQQQKLFQNRTEPKNI